MVWRKGTLSITQTAFIETLAKRFDVIKTPFVPVSPGVNFGAREEGEYCWYLALQGGRGRSDVAGNHVETGHRELCACCGASCPQCHHEALEGCLDDDRSTKEFG